MNELFRNSVKRIIALLLLGFFIFSFLHSELGFFDYDGDSHGTHDHCEIVKNSIPHANILRIEFSKINLNKDICLHCLEEIKAHIVQTSFELSDHHQKTKLFPDLYLFNRTFLI